MASSSEQIRKLNDRFRSGDGSVPGQVFITPGVQALTGRDENTSLQKLIQAVQTYDDFSPDNDPHGEHDFGAFEFGNEKLFWKVDYYAPGLEAGSENPADISKTIRVLTILLASEY